MSSSDTDVLIVGAGPTGLMCAALLLRCGVNIRIVDKAPTQAKESRAIGIQARTLELFMAMGIVDTFLDKGLIAGGVEIYVQGRRAAEVEFGDLARPDAPFNFVFMLPQRDVEAILNGDIEARGVTVERGVEITGFEQAVEGVTVQAKNAEGAAFTLRAAYVIGADGAHSVVRQTLGLPFEGAAYEQGFLLADCKLDWDLGTERFKIFMHDRNFGLFFPLQASGTHRVIASHHESAATDGIDRQSHAPATLAEVQDAFSAAAGIPVTLKDATWVSRYRVHHRGVSRYSRGRVFLAGDAAHIHSPVGAQGMNTGLQDAANLCWKLAMVVKGAASNALLDTYHTERWPVGQKLLHFTDRAFSLLGSGHKAVTVIRNALVPLIAALVEDHRWLRARAFRFVSQLGIRYQGHSFLEDDRLDPAMPWKKAPLPGMRAPNAAIAHGMEVFDLTRGYQFHVLAVSSTAMGGAAIDSLHKELETLPRAVGLPIKTHIIARSLVGRDARILQAENGDVLEAYLSKDVPEALYLIRPDGHIAYRCDRFDIAALTRFIKVRLTGIG